MVSKVLKIIIFDGSFKTTPFINRLADGLSVTHSVYILGFNENIPSKIKNVHYVSLGSNQNKLNFIITTLRLLFNTRKPKLLFPTLKILLQGKRQKIQKQNLVFALNHISPDIIHLQWPSVIPWFEDVLLEQKIPVVLSQRGFHSNVRPFVDGENFDYLKKWYPKMTGFHSVSKAISANGDKIFQAPDKIDKVVYTGIPIPEIPYSKKYVSSKPLKILSIGRAHWIKGYEYALQSCAILKEKKISFSYTIVGASTNEELQFMVTDLGLSEYVILTGKFSQKEVFSLMESSSLLLMPSLEEGIANVVVEAMAVGLPVLSTDCGGMEEVIQNGLNGWIVPSRNPNAMAQAIVDFINKSNKEIETIRFSARQKIEIQHSEEKMVNDMIHLYNEAVNSK
jgi:colanic acid/amylovoran biosynthesis glycosyltransferase